MRRFLSPFLAVVIGLSLLSPRADAQPSPPRISPHETISNVIDNNRITVVYGRPYSKDPINGQLRKIWGMVIPYGRIWRTGADEATLFITQQPLLIGDTTVPAGAYTLYILPEEGRGSKLIFNRQLGQWGLYYDEKQDLARVELKKETLPERIDEFLIAIEPNAGGSGGVLKFVWEKTQLSVAFVVKKSPST